ncbi:threonine--tRNA ligase [Candidatus Woesearchaeota archaeon]|nr:threonine--tRNA ligase [Candidatus Woesearchaeota archaeon]
MTIKVTFPDGTKREYKKGITVLEVAKSISEGLARAALDFKVNDHSVLQETKLDKDCAFKVITTKDKESLEALRHSCAHLLAATMIELYPGAQNAIGPPIEDGFYQDFELPQPISEADFAKIEEKMREIIKTWGVMEGKQVTVHEALKQFKWNKYKTELINEFAEGGKKLTFYTAGHFIDLCKGGHLFNPGKHVQHFKLLSVAGAYWRGDEKNKMLTRIYGTAFFTKKELDEHLHRLEEVKKRDHRILSKKLDLASFHEESPGAIFFHPKGAIIFNELQTFIREQYWERGFSEVITPLVYDKSLWETSGHWGFYKENMFTFMVDGKEVSLKPMNCPSHCLIYKTQTRSYRDLPLRFADFAALHRNELKGVIGGMTRVRKFHQDDAHIFCTEEQLAEELDNCIDFANYVYAKTFDFEFRLELSTKPEKSIGTKEQWDVAERVLKEALDKSKLPYKINPGDGAFYGPKIDLHIKDCLGRSWQLSTIQVDFQQPSRFGLTYEGSDGKKHTPIMIHRAVLGTLDRFIGILIEHCAGKFPLWLSPVQVRLLTINDNVVEYAEQVKAQLKSQKIRTEINKEQETINKKVRDAQMQYIPLIITIGEKEKEAKTLAVRTLDGQVKFGIKLDDFIKHIKNGIDKRMLNFKL